MNPSFTILTVAIGADNRRDLSAGLISKIAYSKLHGYIYIQYEDEIYDQERPPSWYKIKAILEYLESDRVKTDWLFVSSENTIVTNYTKSLSTVINNTTQGDIVWTLDANGHLSSGNMFIRTNSSNVVPFFKRVWDQTKYLYHPWYENAAMVKLYLSDPTVQTFIQTEINSSLFNSYLKCDETEDINQNIQDLIKDDLTKLHWLSERSTLYSPGDLLINLDPLKNTTVIGSEMDKIADPYKTF